MKFNQIKNKRFEQNVNLGQSLKQQTYEDAVPEEVEVTNLSQEDFDTMLSSIIQQQVDAGNTEYSSVIDDLIIHNSGKFFNKDEVRLLKNNNRLRALAYKEDIENIKNAYKQIARSNGKEVSFDKKRYKDLSALVKQISGNDSTITSFVYLELKDIKKELSKKEKDEIIKAEAESVDLNSNAFELNRDSSFTYSDVRLEVILEGLNLYESDNQNVKPEGVPIGHALGMGYDSVLEAEEVNASVISVLGQVDGNTSYIESLFGQELDTIQIDMAGRPENYSAKELWTNCFDCFFNAWNPNSDFAFNLDTEIRVSGLLDVLQDLINAMRYALDIPAIILSNICSLQRLGVLCPIEIAFLIASLVALLRFTINEVILGFPDFLEELVVALLIPLLNIIEVSASFSISPFKTYMGCVFKTMLSTDQVAWTGKFTRAQMHDILNGKNDSQRIQFIPREAKTELLQKAKDWSENTLNDILLNGSGPSPGADLLDLLNIADTIDPIELFKTALIESNDKLTNVYNWIQNTLGALKTFVQGRSVNRMELIAKIIALSTLIGVLVAIGRMIAGNVDVCEEVVEDGVTYVDPKFTPEEFLSLIGMPEYIKVVSRFNPENETIIVEGNPTTPIESVVVNDVTNNRFTLVNCEKGRVRKVSNIELKQILRDIGY